MQSAHTIKQLQRYMVHRCMCCILTITTTNKHYFKIIIKIKAKGNQESQTKNKLLTNI